jgi:hypothetical protein
MRMMTIAAFGAGTLALAFSSAALAQAPGKTHYQCYNVTQAQALKPQAPKLTDQFGTSGPRLGAAVFLCAPVEKNGQPPADKDTHLVCYRISGKNPGKRVSVTHQFGTQTLTVNAATLLCLPSTKKLL